MKVDNIQEGLAEKPVAAAPSTPSGIVYITDSAGRKLGLKKLKPSERFSLSERLNLKTGNGEMQAIFAATVFSIDEDGCPPIMNVRQLMGRLDELDDHGLQAITKELMNWYQINLDEQDVAGIKNA